jgi:hypothetical protein
MGKRNTRVVGGGARETTTLAQVQYRGRMEEPMECSMLTRVGLRKKPGI